MAPRRSLIGDLADLAGRLAGTVHCPAPSQWHRDFGNLRHQEPAAVVLPTHAEDVRETVRFAADRGMRVVARGHGCSSYGQSLTEGIALDTRFLDGCALTGEGTVRVGAGIQYGALCRYLHQHGLALPVVTSSEHASIGGGLSVGGFGPTSPFVGSVADQVVALDVVVGDGDMIHATPTNSYADLFDYALCGLGQVCVIVAAELRVARNPPELLVHQVRGVAPDAFPALAQSVWEDGRWYSCRVSYANTSRVWRVELGRLPDAERAPAPNETPMTDYHGRIFAAEAVFADGIARAQVDRGLLRSVSDACRIWSDFFLPLEHAGRFFAAVAPRFSAPEYTPVVNSTFLRGDAARRRLPLSPLPDSGPVQTFGFYCVVPPDRADEYMAHFDHAASICHELDGRQYLHGYHRSDEEFYRRQFGTATLERWRAMKRRFDPATVLGPRLPALKPHSEARQASGMPRPE